MICTESCVDYLLIIIIVNRTSCIGCVCKHSRSALCRSLQPVTGGAVAIVRALRCGAPANRTQYQYIVRVPHCVIHYLYTCISYDVNAVSSCKVLYSHTRTHTQRLQIHGTYMYATRAKRCYRTPVLAVCAVAGHTHGCHIVIRHDTQHTICVSLPTTPPAPIPGQSSNCLSSSSHKGYLSN